MGRFFPARTDGVLGSWHPTTGMCECCESSPATTAYMGDKLCQPCADRFRKQNEN